MWRRLTFVFLFVIGSAGILFLYDYLTREVSFIERIQLRTKDKIALVWPYGIPGSYDVILLSSPGQKFSREEVESVAHEFQSKLGGEITFVNEWGPNFGIENISEDSAYRISADHRVQVVLSKLSESAPPKTY